MSSAAPSVPDVIARLRRIDDQLPPGDGAAVFNRMYLTVTEQVAAALEGADVFRNPEFMERLDVTFASLWIEAYDARGDDVVPKAWAPLFERRHDSRLLPIQFALAVVATCSRLHLSPDHAGIHEDYEAVNDLLAASESRVRRSFLTEAGRAADEHVGGVVHLISSWNIDKARDVAWVNVEALWALRHIGPLAERYQAALARTVGMVSRYLLTPTQPR